MAFDFEHNLTNDVTPTLTLELHTFNVTFQYDQLSHISFDYNKVLREVHNKWKLIRTSVVPKICKMTNGYVHREPKTLVYDTLSFHKQCTANTYGDLIIELNKIIFDTWLQVNPKTGMKKPKLTVIIDHNGDTFDYIKLSPKSKRFIQGADNIIFQNLNVNVLEYDGASTDINVSLHHCTIDELKIICSPTISLDCDDYCVINKLITIEPNHN